MSRANSYRMLAVGRVNRKQNELTDGQASGGETDEAASDDVSRGARHNGVTTRKAAKAERQRPAAPPRDEQDRLQAQLRTDVDALVALIGRSLTGGLLAKHAKRLDVPIERPARNGQPATTFDAATLTELVALGKPHLLAVQHKINEALRVAR